jgi:hypothetical protein
MNETGENERIHHRIHPHHSGQQVETPSHSSFEGFANFVVSTSVFGIKRQSGGNLDPLQMNGGLPPPHMIA